MAEQFDPRYEITPRRGRNAASHRQSSAALDAQHRAMEDIPHRPANIEWFIGQLTPDLASNDAPVVGIYCNLVPAELVFACGAIPVRLDCGNSGMVTAGDEVVPGEICPLAKASLATLLDEAFDLHAISTLVLPACCDAKRKCGELMSDLKPTFMLNMPTEQDAGRFLPASVKEFDRLRRWLTKTLKTRFSRRRLRREIQLSAERTALIRQLGDLHSQTPEAIDVRDVFIIVQSAWSGVATDAWNTEVRKVIAELEAFEPTRRRTRPRVVLTGAPIIWPNFKVLNLLVECGADVIADTTCGGLQCFHEAAVVDERSRRSLLRALAMRDIFATTCPCFISQGRRLARVEELVSDHRADAVVNYGLRLCQLFDIETYRLSTVMKQREVPLATVRTDYSLEDTEQLRVRIEAFLETVWDRMLATQGGAS